MNDLATLKEERSRIWSTMPLEVREMATRTGALRPLGPILYAESETRVYTELLSQYVLMDANEHFEPNAPRPDVLWLLSRLASHLSGWYGLPEAGHFVKRALGIIKGSDVEAARACLTEIVLYLTRLNFWLDLLIPWDALNQLSADLLITPPTSYVDDISTTQGHQL